MISFESDYNNGCTPEILRRLADTNDDRTSGYGSDSYCQSAIRRIREAVQMTDADVFFLTGGTQTNATVIDSLLMGCEAVITVETGHIAVHESGAVEAFGHRVITLPAVDSKLTAATLDRFMDTFTADETAPHMVQPGMVYVSMPTELGMVYTRSELASLYEACRRHHLRLYIDGARLGYGLMSDACDYDLPFLARHCDVFYIGGTKVGAMFGEAVVFTGISAPKYFFTTVKRHGALLAKGRMLGIQFDTLFTDGLYERIGADAVRYADAIRRAMAENGYLPCFPSPTNQSFCIVSEQQRKELAERVDFSVWEQYDETHSIIRFATSWATREEDVNALCRILRECTAQEKAAS